MPLPGHTDQSAEIKISTSGTLYFGFLNIRFLVSLLGALQALTLVLVLIVTCLLGVSVSESTNVLGETYKYIQGLTFYVFLLMVSFWCLLNTGFIYISCAFSLVTSALMGRTVYFILYNAMAGLFFLCSAITSMAEASTFSQISSPDRKNTILAASGIGIAAGILYVCITIVAVIKYRKEI